MWAERFLASAVRLLPARRRELGQALLAEASTVPPGRRRLAWVAGGLWFVVKESAVRKPGYVLGLIAAVAVLVGVDRIGTSDDSGMVSLAVLLLASAVLGFAAPRWAWLSGLVLGAAIALADLTYATVGPAPAHPMSPAGVTGAATMLVLIVPALVAAYLGAGAAWLLRDHRTGPVS
jgi:hypothetical protein